MLSHLVLFVMLIGPLKCNMPKCYGKNGHIDLSSFIIKNHGNKKNFSSPHLYKKNHANYLRNNFFSSFFCDHNSKWKSRNYMHYANIVKPKWFGYIN